MLAIRMKRTGRHGHAQFRLVVQDSRFSPTSGRVVAYLGSYDPHSKVASFDKEKASHYLNNGAQPSDRAARLMKKEGVKLPTWVKLSEPGKRTTRNPEKLRRNRPAEIKTEEPAAAEAADQPAEEQPVEVQPADPAEQAETASDTPEAEVSSSEEAANTQTPEDKS